MNEIGIGAQVRHRTGTTGVVMGLSQGVRGTPCAYVGAQDGSSVRMAVKDLELLRPGELTTVVADAVKQCEQELALVRRVERDLWIVHRMQRGMCLGDLRAEQDNIDLLSAEVNHYRQERDGPLAAHLAKMREQQATDRRAARDAGAQ